MTPCPIADTNLTLTAPSGMEGEVSSIEARRDEVLGHQCVSTAWMPNPEERSILTAGGPVVLTVMGTTMPPVMLSVQPPAGFTYPEEITRSARLLAVIQEIHDAAVNGNIPDGRNLHSIVYKCKAAIAAEKK